MYQNLIYISRYLDFYYQILNPYLLLPTPPLPTTNHLYPYPPPPLPASEQFLQGQLAHVPWTYFYRYFSFAPRHVTHQVAMPLQARHNCNVIMNNLYTWKAHSKIYWYNSETITLTVYLMEWIRVTQYHTQTHAHTQTQIPFLAHWP